MAHTIGHATIVDLASRKGAAPQQRAASLRLGMAAGFAKCTRSAVQLGASVWQAATLGAALVEGSPLHTLWLRDESLHCLPGECPGSAPCYDGVLEAAQSRPSAWSLR